MNEEEEWLRSTDPSAMLARVRHSDLRSSLIPPVGPASGRKLRLFACACCRQVWHLLTDERSRRAVEASERYADGEATRNELDAARYAAWDVAGAAARAAAWAAAWDAAWAVAREAAGDTADYAALHAADDAAQAAALGTARDNAPGSAWAAAPDGAWVTSQDVAWEAARAQQAVILRDVVGNPWQPVGEWYRGGEGVEPQPPEWLGPLLTPTVLALARAAYDERPGRVCQSCRGTGGLFGPPTQLSDGKVHPYGGPCKVCRKSPRDELGTGRIEDGLLAPDRLAVLADALEDAGCDHQDLLRHLRGQGPHVRGCWALDVILGYACKDRTDVAELSREE